MNPTSERSSHPSLTQIEALVEFLEQNPGLAKGHIKSQHGRDQSRRKWEEISVRLNSMGGAIKAYKQWTKYWTDKRSALKRKVSARNSARRRTGGGLDEEIVFSEVEERMIALCGGESFSIGDPHLGIQLILPSTQPQIQYGPSDVPNLSQGNPTLEEDDTEVLEIPAQTNSGNGNNISRTVRRLFDSSDDSFAAGSSGNTLHVSPVPLPLEYPTPPPPTLSHTPTTVPIPVASPSRRGITDSTSSGASFVIRARRRRQGRPAQSSSQQQSTPATLDPLVASPSRRGSTTGSHQTGRVSGLAGTSTVSRQGHPLASAPSQRRTEFSTITDRFLRVAEQQVEVQQSNARVVQTMLELSTGRDRDLVEAVTAMGERVVDRICERDRVLADAVAAIGEGLKALAEVAKAFKP